MSGCFENGAPNIEGLRNSVNLIYEASGLQRPGEVYVANGPGEASHLLFEMASRREDIGKNLDDSFFDTAVSTAKELRYVLETNLSLDDCASIRNMIFWDLNFQISKCLMEPMLHALRKQGLVPSSYDLRIASNPSFADIDWIGFYALCRKVGVFDHSVPEGYSHFAMHKGCFLYAFERMAIVVPRPDLICRNDAYQLHGDGVAALSWRDGTSLYFHHGVAIPSKLIENPEEITREEIIAENNAEVRRCYQEILGSERFGKLLGLTQIDAQKDRFGHEIALYKTKDRDKFANDHIFFAQVICPSTLRQYFLCVPPTIKTAREAVAWTFGKSVEEYKPEIET